MRIFIEKGTTEFINPLMYPSNIWMSSDAQIREPNWNKALKRCWSPVVTSSRSNMCIPRPYCSSISFGYGIQCLERILNSSTNGLPKDSPPFELQDWQSHNECKCKAASKLTTLWSMIIAVNIEAQSTHVMTRFGTSAAAAVLQRNASEYPFNGCY